MSYTYPFTKTPLNTDKLELEIRAEEFSQALADVFDNGEASDNLKLTYAAQLLTAEEATQTTIVTNHDGNPPTLYGYFCHAEGKWREEQALSSPSQCHVCSSTDIQFYRKDNLIATSNPTVNDDISLGYTVGSKWINVSTDEVFQCTNSTDGAAVWKQTSNV